jgi:hypothetical protein
MARLTNYGLDEHVFNALSAGASGFLVKDTEPARGILTGRWTGRDAGPLAVTFLQ